MSRSSRSEGASTTVVDRLARHERGFWLAAVVWYGVGDTLTTLVGLSYTDAAEIGPIAGPAIDAHGGAGLLAVKLVLFAAAALAWSRIDRPTRVAIPVAITVVGTAVTVWNAVVILLATW